MSEIDSITMCRKVQVLTDGLGFENLDRHNPLLPAASGVPIRCRALQGLKSAFLEFNISSPL